VKYFNIWIDGVHFQGQAVSRRAAFIIAEDLPSCSAASSIMIIEFFPVKH